MGKTPAPEREGQSQGTLGRSPQGQRKKHHSLMGQVLDLRRLRAAYAAVRANRGDPGVDGVTGETCGDNLEANLTALITELRAKTYRPQPVRRLWIPKPDGRQRPLGIPAVRDRVVGTRCSPGATGPRRSSRCWSRSLRRSSRLTAMGSGQDAAR